jgi:A/G-specific adenine glycosylase
VEEVVGGKARDNKTRKAASSGRGSAEKGAPAKRRAKTNRPAAASEAEVVASAVAVGPDGDRVGSTLELDPVEFRLRLMAWYGAEARTLPWRGTTDPYQIWVSEIMLQQTRVAAVIEHYNEFLRRFPTLLSLALAEEAEVLAAWSGLGYYRRARMLHKAARFIVLERDGRLPATAVDLRTLPGIGEYTAAAISSIAFGEAVAVVDGNVERVVLRLAGRANEATAAARAFIRTQAQALVPQPEVDLGGGARHGSRPRGNWNWDASERIALAALAHPTEPVGGSDSTGRLAKNSAGDHNQAMMELGATVCLPRAPLCIQCPVHALCRTRGEHGTARRAPQRSLPVAYLLDLRKRGTATEVLLSLRGTEASLMPAMFELPLLPLEAVEGREPVLRVRHSITNTNYYVQVFAPGRNDPGGRRVPTAPQLRRAITKNSAELHWVSITRLSGLPLTGLTRKILQRLHVMESARMSLLE